MDEVTDISVLELLVTFIQYVHDGEVKKNFLFVEDLLKASSSADANTIYTGLRICESHIFELRIKT